MGISPLGRDICDDAHHSKEDASVAGVDVLDERCQGQADDVEAGIEEHDGASDLEMVCSKGADHDPDRSNCIWRKGQELSSACRVAKAVFQDDREEIGKCVHAGVVQHKVKGELPKFPVSKVLHGDLEADLVFDCISTVSLDTSEHDCSFFGGKESWQTDGVLDSCFFGEIHDYRKRSKSNNGADDALLFDCDQRKLWCAVEEPFDLL